MREAATVRRLAVNRTVATPVGPVPALLLQRLRRLALLDLVVLDDDDLAADVNHQQLVEEVQAWGDRRRLPAELHRAWR